jgi:hypothetical protein
MTSDPRRWLPLVAILATVSLSAATPQRNVSTPQPTANITAAEVDDIGHGDVGASITFIVRAPKNTKLSVQSVGRRPAPLRKPPRLE